MNDIVEKKAGEIVTSNFKDEIINEIKTDVQKSLRNHIKNTVVFIQNEMRKRDIWIKRREEEKKQLEEIQEKLFAAAEIGDRAEVRKLAAAAKEIGGTGGLKEYYKKYGTSKQRQLVDELAESEDENDEY